MGRLELMAGKRDLRSKVASFFELPGDVIMDVARISLVGDVELLIENHRGVAEYRQDRVVLGVPRGKVAITGDALSISSISPDQVLILGKIRSVQYLD
jgi:sporulation protein YqfC